MYISFYLILLNDFYYLNISNRWHVAMYISIAMTDKDEAISFWCDGGWKFKRAKTKFQKRYFKSNPIFSTNTLELILR